MNVLLVLALAVLLGGAGARLFKKLRIPRVVAYILIGLLLGPSALNVIRPEMVQNLEYLSFFALGIIGFTIGGELRADVFRKYGNKTLVILLSEGLAAFALVTLATGLFTGNWALAIVLGALSSATAPAATLDVMNEYKTMGVLSTMVLAVVALDDGFALLLYGFASSIASVMINGGGLSWTTAVGRPLFEILGSAALGVGTAFLLRQALRLTRESELILGFAVGSILLVVGASVSLGVDLILGTMFLGAVFVNLAPREAPDVFKAVEKISPPIYVLFFVLVGAHLHVAKMAGWMWMTAALYVLARTAGKVAGSYAGARLTAASSSVRRYLGMCLLPQGGVAMGLAILAAHTFRDQPDMAIAVVAVVTTTTFLVELLGPPMTRMAMIRAQEVGRNITEEDLLATYKVRDVMEKSPPSVRQNAHLSRILRVVADSDAVVFPVLSEDGELQGVISMDELRTVLHTAGALEALVVAMDLMRVAPVSVAPDEPLKDALAVLRDRGVEFLPVTEGGNGKFLGLLERRRVQRVLAEEVVRRRVLARG